MTIDVWMHVDLHEPTQAVRGDGDLCANLEALDQGRGGGTDETPRFDMGKG
jgi:hypothetical protein